MQRNTLFSILATAALGIVMAGPASADDPDPGKYRTQATGNWNASATWEVLKGSDWVNAESYPQTGDTANILNGHTVTLQQDEDLATMTVNSVGVVRLDGDNLDITGSSGLTVNGTVRIDGTSPELKVSGGGTHNIGSGGLIRLETDSAVFLLSSTATISGVGSVTGENDSAEFRIAANTMLTNTTSIVGKMKIVGQTPAGPGNAGKLDNRGAVVANALNGILELGSNLLLADTAGSGRWEASGQGSAILLFSNAHTCALKGDVRLGDCAKIQFDVDIDTQGSLLHDATNNKGKIEVNNGATFGYSCNTADPCVCTDITEDRTLGCP